MTTNPSEVPPSERPVPFRVALRALVVVGILSPVACADSPATWNGLSDAETDAIRAVEQSYVEAWEANDSAAVMTTLAPDAVLVPDGMEPIRGDSAIRAFWWPGDGSETRVTRYATTIEEVGGRAGYGYMSGRGRLAFDWRRGPDEAWQSFTSHSVWLALVRRRPDGSWRMTHRMWHQVADEADMADGPPADTVEQAEIPDDDLRYFAGSWHASAEDPTTGRTFTLRYDVRPVLGETWLSGHGRSAELEVEVRDMWGRDAGSGDVVRVIFQNDGSHGTIRSTGWTGDTLRFQGDVRTADGITPVRQTITRLGPDEFRAVWEARLEDGWTAYSDEHLTRQSAP